MGSSAFIDVGLANVWRSWFSFRKGKRKTAELHEFQYRLEENLLELFCDLNTGRYCHGGYKKFIVSDNKRREISVASIRDRVVHRLVYDFLTPIYDKTFIYDAWSCRVSKGLLGAIERAQDFMCRYPLSYIWKADVQKFFDSVDQKTLLKILSFRIKDAKSYRLIQQIIGSFGLDKSWGWYAYRKSYKSDLCQYLFQRIRSIYKTYFEVKSISTLRR